MANKILTFEKIEAASILICQQACPVIDQHLETVLKNVDVRQQAFVGFYAAQSIQSHFLGRLKSAGGSSIRSILDIEEELLSIYRIAGQWVPKAMERFD